MEDYAKRKYLSSIEAAKYLGLTVDALHTLVENGTSQWGGGILNENPDITNLLIRNNLCSQNTSFQIAFEVPSC